MNGSHENQFSDTSKNDTSYDNRESHSAKQGRKENNKMGFRPNRSTTDSIFIVRQIYKKCFEYNIDLHNIFIDFSYAFNTVNRDVTHNSLIKYNAPDKLIHLIKLTMQRTNMKVEISNNCAEWI
jgi:hypothetical protein